METVNEEIGKLVENGNGIKSTITKCNSLLSGNDDIFEKDREKKILSMKDAIFQQYGIHEKAKQYLVSNTKMAEIIFDDTSRSSIHNLLASYGTIKERQDRLNNIPEVMLKDALLSKSEEDGYRVNLEWQILNQVKSDQNNPATIMFRKSANNDEKKQDSEWNVAHHDKVKQDDNQIYHAPLTDLYQYGTTYQYQISMAISNPITMTIKSNTIASSFKNPKPPQKISLNVDSYKRFADDNNQYHPKNLLIANSSCYYSARNRNFNGSEADWIIFKSDGLYLPTTFKIKNHNSSQGVKTMRIAIGNNQDWKYFNPNPINVAESKELQSFNIDGVDETEIRRKGFQYIKIEFITNHGCTESDWCRFAVEQFMLYGIKL